MSTLDSTSTLAEVRAAYADNASYSEDGSVAKAHAFITACRLLLSPLHSPRRSIHGGRGSGEEVEFDLAVIQTELRDAARWLTTHSGVTAGGSGVKVAMFGSRFRG